MIKVNIRWYRTIRMKVVGVVVVSCILVLGSLSAYNTINEQKQLTADLEKLARVTSQRLSRHLIGPLWDLDKELVDSTLEAEMLEENIHAIVVWDEAETGVFAARELDNRHRVGHGSGNLCWRRQYAPRRARGRNGAHRQPYYRNSGGFRIG